MAVKRAELESNLRLLSEWDQDFEVPDVIRLADYLYFGPRFAADLAQRVFTHRLGRVESFPYPDGVSKVREVAILQPEDLVLLRTFAGRIAAQTEELLPEAVCSYRLRSRPPAWRFRSPHGAYRTMIDRALELLKQDTTKTLCKTDIANYFPSVDWRLVSRSLIDWDCELPEMNMVQLLLEAWSARGHRGLPVGPEISSVLGNALLLPLDLRLMAEDVAFLRYVDDILLFSSSLANLNEIVRILDEEAAQLGLVRSREKTHPFEDAVVASDHLRDLELAYLGAQVRSGEEQGVRRMHQLCNEEIFERRPEKSRFRWALRQLIRQSDPYLATALAEDPELMAVDAKLSGKYLAATGLRLPSVRDAMMSLISQDSEKWQEAIQLHLLIAACESPWGGAEGNIFRQVADNRKRKAPIREWAWRALSRTPAWTPSTAMEAVWEEPHPRVRRAIVAGLRWTSSRQSVRPFTRKVRSAYPELAVTADWVEAA